MEKFLNIDDFFKAMWESSPTIKYKIIDPERYDIIEKKDYKINNLKNLINLNKLSIKIIENKIREYQLELEEEVKKLEKLEKELKELDKE